MTRVIAVLLSCVLLLTGCVPSKSSSVVVSESGETIVTEGRKGQAESVSQKEAEKPNETPYQEENTQSLSYRGLEDTELLTYIENNIYTALVCELDSDDYFVEKLEAVYLSQEYIDELAYNSQTNIFFGFTLDELKEEFQGKRYVFTLGEDGQTTVKELEEVYDDTYDQVIKNVAIGGGVILVCVTISVATMGAAPAVSMIFAASAKTGTIFALKSGAISFAAASLARGYQTHDFEQAMKAGALAASESFKWSAIIGSATGGITEGVALKAATLNGLTMNEAAAIQRESKWPLKAIKSLNSKAEYEIYKNAKLVPTQLSDGSWTFLKEINWKLVDSYGRTNVERVTLGLAPIDSTGMPYELHHIGQKADSPLAILTYVEHHSKDNYSILHYAEEGKDVADDVWRAQKKEFWNAILKMAQGA